MFLLHDGEGGAPSQWWKPAYGLQHNFNSKYSSRTRVQRTQLEPEESESSCGDAQSEYRPSSQSEWSDDTDDETPSRKRGCGLEGREDGENDPVLKRCRRFEAEIGAAKLRHPPSLVERRQATIQEMAAITGATAPSMASDVLIFIGVPAFAQHLYNLHHNPHISVAHPHQRGRKIEGSYRDILEVRRAQLNVKGTLKVVAERAANLRSTLYVGKRKRSIQDCNSREACELQAGELTGLLNHLEADFPKWKKLPRSESGMDNRFNAECGHNGGYAKPGMQQPRRTHHNHHTLHPSSRFS